MGRPEEGAGRETWEAWRTKFNSSRDIGDYLYWTLFNQEDGWYLAWGEEVGLTPGEQYDSRAMDWHMLVTNSSIDALHNAGLDYREAFFPVGAGHIPGSVAEVFQTRSEGFVVVDPGPKSIRGLKLKMQEEGVESAAQVYDFIRITFVGADVATCERIMTALQNSAEEFGFFAPLTEEERTLSTGRVVPAVTNIGNRHSAPELVEMIEAGRGYAQTLRLQIGPAAIGRQYFQYDTDEPGRLRYFPPPGLRVSLTIMTPDIFEFMNDPASPAHHDRYATRKEEARRMVQQESVREFLVEELGLSPEEVEVVMANTHRMGLLW